MLARRSDLPLEKDISRRYLPWIIAVMVYLAALALAGALALDAAASRWSQGLRGTLTVQIPSVDGAKTEGRVSAVLELLATIPSVAQARALKPDELAALLEPWLGANSLSPELPVPQLIDVRLEPGAEIDLESLAKELAEAAPGARLEDHKLWLGKVIRFTRSVQLLAAAVVLLIAGVASAIVVFTTRAGLAVHQQVIEVLHRIGARDSYIASQFQIHALLLGLRGGFVGLGVAALTLLLLARVAGSLEESFFAGLALSAGGWAALAGVPLVAALIVTLTARATVMRALARMV